MSRAEPFFFLVLLLVLAYNVACLVWEAVLRRRDRQ